MKVLTFATLVLSSFILANLASAQTTVGLSRIWGATGTVSTQGGSGFDLRNLRMCLVADTQNIVAQIGSQMTDTAPPVTNFNCKTNAGQGCTGLNCDKSTYCDVSWQNTGRMAMRNLAYDLTGQTNLIDWTRIVGSDSAINPTPETAPSHDGCDVILSLGDMEGIPSGIEETGANSYIETSTYADLGTVGYSYQTDGIDEFWNIIDRTGIPYLMLQGNHDAWSTFKTRYTRLGTSSKSWFYAKEETYDLSYAILVPIGGGKSICFISLSWADANQNDTRRDETVTWLSGTAIGCGANHPTAIITHSEVTSVGAISNVEGHAAGASTNPVLATIVGESIVAGGTYPGTAGTSEVFMAAAGHWIISPATSVKTSVTGLFGVDTNAAVYLYFSNWQQEQRHASNNTHLGPTPADSGGAWYTVVDLQPDRDRICAYDWSPYWQTTQGSPANGQLSSVVTSSGCQAFDFDTRFP